MKISILTPIGRQPAPMFMESVLRLVGSVLGVELEFTHVDGHANTPRVRNILAYKAWASGADSVCFIDDDIEFGVEAFERLYSHDAPVVAGAPQRRGSEQFCCSIGDEPARRGELISGRAATAFMRIDRPVLDRLAKEVECFAYEGVGDQIPAWFNYKIAPLRGGLNGFVGEDYYFSDLCKDSGIPVWIDPHIRLKHWQYAPLEGCLADHL